MEDNQVRILCAKLPDGSLALRGFDFYGVWPTYREPWLDRLEGDGIVVKPEGLSSFPRAGSDTKSQRSCREVVGIQQVRDLPRQPLDALARALDQVPETVRVRLQ